jgi:hypothetical protein
MNEKNQFRPQVEGLESRDAPGSFSYANPWVNVWVRWARAANWLRHHPGSYLVRVQAPHTFVFVSGTRVIVRNF